MCENFYLALFSLNRLSAADFYSRQWQVRLLLSFCEVAGARTLSAKRRKGKPVLSKNYKSMGATRAG